MTKIAPEIDDSLHLCKEMGAPSVVVPVSTIERYFPSTKHPAYPNLPSYELGEVRDWAKTKGWSVSFATTGTTTDKRMVPGLRFTPLIEEKAVHDPATNPAAGKPSGGDDWHNKPIGVVVLGVVTAIVVATISYAFHLFFGITL